jgi:hypothetical protein
MYQNNVYIKQSEVCSGLGIFARKIFKENDIITWYYGDIVDYKYINSKKYKRNKYIIEYKSLNKKKIIIGISDINKIKGKGLAQLANDAICFNLTKKNNNSYFTQKGRYILLIASRTIYKNEEILVPYGMEYWMKEIKYKYNIKNKIYDYKFKETINILYYLTKLIKDYFLCNVYEIKDVKDKYKIFFELTEQKRWCINFNIWHYDEYFYIFLKKEQENDKINIYYTCLTCRYDYKFLIDKTTIDMNIILNF